MNLCSQTSWVLTVLIRLNVCNNNNKFRTHEPIESKICPLTACLVSTCPHIETNDHRASHCWQKIYNFFYPGQPAACLVSTCPYIKANDHRASHCWLQINIYIFLISSRCWVVTILIHLLKNTPRGLNQHRIP